MCMRREFGMRAVNGELLSSTQDFQLMFFAAFINPFAGRDLCKWDIAAKKNGSLWEFAVAQ